MELTDYHLINLAISGDSLAANHLLAKYRKKIFMQIRTQVDDHSIVNDLVQDVCLKVFRYLPTFKYRSSFSTWLYKITQTTIINYFRAIKLELSLSDYCISPENINNSPEFHLTHLELQQKVNEMVLKMPNELQHCFHLYVTQGLSYKVIAKRLQCPLGTVRSRIHRLRNFLKERLSAIS
ncbi:RNA polymerase sigma factor [Legionella hackeliae]|uniref:RNA polymerase sigma-24 factor RpoE n=1 Tax=Legionella hackeliae TaxID=449 RepID=A0A0A8UP54_LEGHA|nr:sigma-70 family RNA polymerase sigma factor [Legionella hackeliae]KTD13901.1 Sigma factor RpoE (sigma 24) [Legionella hackeliae]CEK10605.1 RNA polymerase sigma-24 factor RpoE [Legionella hackeliae]STX47347.1 Sigma factor RpoE (sigma 24) [Legionella hackeliae]